MRNKDVIRIVLAAMLITMVYVATYIGIPLPSAAGGYMHFGTVVLLVIAMRFGKYYGAMAGGIGMALFDILSAYTAWAPGTFVVRFTMGYVIGWIAQDNNLGQGGNLIKNLIGWFFGLVIMIIGYYLYEAIFLTTFTAALASIPGNLVQFGIGLAAPFIAYGMKDIKQIDELLQG